KRVQYLCASATRRSPHHHVKKLFGRDFEVIDADDDGSPRHPVSIRLLTTESDNDLLASISHLLKSLVSGTDMRFICFTDSRKQVEALATIVGRQAEKPAEEASSEPSDSHPLEDLSLPTLSVLPY